MSIGQAGKRARQFSTQHQRRHTVQYDGGSTEPLIQRTPMRRTTAQTSISSVASPVASPVTDTRVIQRNNTTDVDPDTNVEEGSETGSVQNPGRGENNSSTRTGRSSETANVEGEENKELNPDVIADKVYEIMLRENRDFIDRSGKRLSYI